MKPPDRGRSGRGMTNNRMMTDRDGMTHGAVKEPGILAVGDGWETRHSTPTTKSRPPDTPTTRPAGARRVRTAEP